MPAQAATASVSRPVAGKQMEEEEEDEEEAHRPLIGFEEKFDMPFHAHFSNENKTRVETVIFEDGSIHHFYPRIVFDHRIWE